MKHIRAIIVPLLLSCGPGTETRIEIPAPTGDQGGANIQVCATSGTTGSCRQGGDNTNATSGSGDIAFNASVPFDPHAVPACDPADTTFTSGAPLKQLFLAHHPPFTAGELAAACGPGLENLRLSEYPRTAVMRVRGTCADVIDQTTGQTETYTLLALNIDPQGEISTATAGRSFTSGPAGHATRLDIAIAQVTRAPGEPVTLDFHYQFFAPSNASAPCAEGNETVTAVPHPEDDPQFSCEDVRFARAYGDLVTGSGGEFVVTNAVRFHGSAATVIQAEDCDPDLPEGEHPVTISLWPDPGPDPQNGCVGMEDVGAGEIIVLGCEGGVLFPIGGSADELGYFCPVDVRDPADASFFGGVIDFSDDEATTSLIMRYVRRPEDIDAQCDVIAFRADLTEAALPP